MIAQVVVAVAVAATKVVIVSVKREKKIQIRDLNEINN
jgi:hypothetical protein